MKHSRSLLASLGATLLLVACGKSEAPSSPGRLSIAVIPKGANQVYWKSVHAGAVQAAEELGVEVIWKGPIKEDDRESQIKVVVLRFLEGSASTEQRCQGFLDTLKLEFPHIEVVSSNQRAGATAEVAYQNSENLLAPFKKPGGGIGIDGLFCPNESTTFAMLRALQDGGLAGQVRFVGFDSSDMLVAAMKKGELHGLVLQDPIRMGYLGVKTMAAHLKGEKVSPRIDTGCEVASPDNMNDPAIRSLLNPDYKRWLKEN